ncbi:hypothetical protein MNQ98_05610 [Paenibacillus sp. N3/727]|uniref:hypothetical protein n=1 Tax=Paenibacillus sp. N3/727 TaxID=2925845 RepID=UPI001F5335F7|nr:hypothetical protein [Paenibacillus sp. N3/727]UNK19507.1 hypothetical protein MNQ98_05610 [Paenibacillus sp. N3/727]
METMLVFIEVDVRKLEEDKKRLSEYDSSTDVEGFIKRLYDPMIYSTNVSSLYLVRM